MTGSLTQQSRSEGVLFGLALGDALGMPTQAMSREEIRDCYGVITGVVDAVKDQPVAPGMRAGSVTDDTEQAILLGELLVAGRGRIDPRHLAVALMAWEERMEAAGSLDLLGPSTKAAIQAVKDGEPPELSGRFGTTNGAAMRIASVGIAVAPDDGLLAAVFESCQVTHNTGLGISGAAAIAGVVSAGLDGDGFEAALDLGIALAEEGQSLGHWVAGASIPVRFRALRGQTRNLNDAEFAEFLYSVVGTSVQSQESVVSALLVADRFRDEPFAALCCAAQLGGDTDTIGAMAGAMLGAFHGVAGFPEAELSVVREVSGIAPERLVADLLALRNR